MKQQKSLVFIHGWGMNRHVWVDVIKHFKQLDSFHYQISTLELPGHGMNAACDIDTALSHFDDWVAYLAKQLEPNTHLVGWSLGGLLALSLAKNYPDKVKSLTLVGSTPCFVVTKDWPYATEINILDQFCSQLEKNNQKTISYFWSLQLLGTSITANIKQIRKKVMAEMASPTSLRLGLEWLKNIDLRNELPEQPQYWYLGGNDPLIPSNMLLLLQQYYEKHRPNQLVQYKIQENLGHGVFINEPNLFSKRLFNWLETII